MSNEMSIFTDQTGVQKPRGKELSALGKALASPGMTGRRIQTNANGTFKRLINGEQIGDAIKKTGADVLIINVDLSATQANNIEAWLEKVDDTSF